MEPNYEKAPWLKEQCIVISNNSKDKLGTWWNFTNSSRMPSVSLVTIGALYKYATVTQAFCKYFPTNVV